MHDSPSSERPSPRSRRLRSAAPRSPRPRGGGSQPTKAPAVVQQDSAKAGDATDEPAEKGDTDTIQDENGKDDASEAAEGPESDEAEAAESGAEVPGDDGPGGWADEPANPNADTQQQGEH